MRKPIHAAGLTVAFLLAWPAGALMLDIDPEGATGMPIFDGPRDASFISYGLQEQIQVVSPSSPDLSLIGFDWLGLLNVADALTLRRLGDRVNDNAAWLDSMNSGGSNNTQTYVPLVLFERAGTTQYVNLYSRFGETYAAANDAYQDSGMRSTAEVVPEPTPLILMAVGLAGIFGFKRKRRI
ncbi:MAG: PEP-CTERM sorting domain-containing protein [Candidatus Hydrogenedentes bacterium]|nr:PEP-CTERM sorting domain-containing protein [Candidatus Hydrogenedentota bacterium]